MVSKIHCGGVQAGQAERSTIFNASRRPHRPLLAAHLKAQHRSKPVQDMFPKRKSL